MWLQRPWLLSISRIRQARLWLERLWLIDKSHPTGAFVARKGVAYRQVLSQLLGLLRHLRNNYHSVLKHKHRFDSTLMYKRSLYFGSAGVHSNQDPKWCAKNRGIYGFLGPSWVVITYITCPPGIGCLRRIWLSWVSCSLFPI